TTVTVVAGGTAPPAASTRPPAGPPAVAPPNCRGRHIPRRRLGGCATPGPLLAVVSRRWLTLRDTYGVDVVRDDADPALLIALTVCVIHLAEKEREDD
ncbi:hypothetical protein ACFV7N_04235, partial [Streptomyces tendae]